MRNSEPPLHLILSHAPGAAYVPLARAILAKMGYRIFEPGERAELPASVVGREPELRIALDSQLSELAELPDEPGRNTPLILITSGDGVCADDPNILGAVGRPAGLHELYRLLQQAFEAEPRSAPRIPTHLPALCRQEKREWRASVLSLSENGCLLRTPEALPLGSHFELRFDLPGSGPLEMPAEASYQLPPDHGLVFSALPAPQREAICAFVERSLGEQLAQAASLGESTGSV